MIRRLLGAAGSVVAAMLLAAQAPPPVPATNMAIPVRVDHHVHVHSPAILAILPAYCNSPGRIGKCDPAFQQALSPRDLLAAMDWAGVRRGLIMSTAYLAESPMMVPPLPNAAAIVRAANDWTVALAKRYPRRLSAFIGINPLTPTALSEIARWRGNRYVTGIKLHLTNSGVDLRYDHDVAALAAVFRAGAAAQLPIMIHMRTRAKDYGARDVHRFVNDVLPQAGNDPVQIAHAAGWGGLDDNTLAALGAFAEAIEADRARFDHVWFDLAAVWNNNTPASDLAKLVALIRRIGPAHFLPASDWPFSRDLAHYYAETYPRLPLTPAEWAIIRSNTLLTRSNKLRSYPTLS